MSRTERTLDIENLSATIGRPASDGSNLVLRGVSLSVAPGEVHGLVGESGAGKSMIGKAIAGLLPRIINVVGGTIKLAGTNLDGLSPKDRRRYIGQNTAIIPQDPLSALNPSRRIGPQMTDRLTRTLGWRQSSADARALELLEEVRLSEPRRVMHSYPHELSGGMRQRVLIAAAFAAEPKLIIADEPTTALDVTVQKQVLRLISEMQSRTNTALLFVTHDMGVVAKICQNVSVLFQGRIVEQTSAQTLFGGDCHPYARALIAATPRYDAPNQSLTPISQSILDDMRAEIAADNNCWQEVQNG